MRKMKLALTVWSVFMMIAALAFTASADESVDMSRFKLKDGHVYKEGTAIDCEVNEVPAEIEGPIRYWSAFGPETSDAVKENETGVWFFSAEGESLRFAPLESETACQGVLFSPDGEKFVLQSGSEMGPDVTFEIYGEGPEKIATLNGIINNIEWADSFRLLMTRVDDTRENQNYENRGGRAFGLRTSVVMFDAAVKETVVLKESTATQNFFFENIVENEDTLNGREDYVKSEADWGDDDKEQSREIRVEIPAAG